LFLVARIVKLITAVVVGFIVVGIVLHLLDANSGNVLVSFVYDVAGFFVTPFEGIFSLDSAKAQIAANWGLAAVVYAIVGGLIARLLTGMSRGGEAAPGRRRASAV
jgi:xanthine/uracil permease